MIDDWDARLRQIAEEHPDVPGRAGELLRARLARQARFDLARDIELAHARAREAVVTGTRMALRCGALLRQAPADELPTVMRAAGITPQAGERYMRLAEAFTDLRKTCERRNGRISEADARRALRADPGAPDPVADLLRLVSVLNDDGIQHVAG